MRSLSVRIGAVIPVETSAHRRRPVVLYTLLVAGAALLAAEISILAPAFLTTPPKLVDAARQTAHLAANYAALRDADVNDTLFPVAVGLAGKDKKSGAANACGVTVSSIDLTGPTPKVTWQRSTGACAETRLGPVGAAPVLPTSALNQGAQSLLAVEVVSNPLRTLAPYAVSYAVPVNDAQPRLAAPRP